METTVVREWVFQLRICTPLPDEEAVAWANANHASGTRDGWMLDDHPANAPVPCDDKPDTHRHIMLEC